MNSHKQFELFFKKSYTPLGMFVLRITGNIAESEDIIQDAFATLWQYINENEWPDNPRAFLYRTARNSAVDTLRKKKRNPLDNSLSDLTDAEIAEEDIDTSERDAAVWNAIGRLPEKCRRVFLLSKQDGLSNAEIATEMGISVKTVENQMTKAFKSLRECLGSSSSKIFFLPFL